MKKFIFPIFNFTFYILRFIFLTGFLWTVGCGLWTTQASAQEKIIPVIVDGDEVVYAREEGLITAHGNVVMKHEGVIMECDEAVYEVAKRLARAKGNVKIIKDSGVLTGSEAIYDFAAQTAEITNMRISSSPIYGAAPYGEKISDDEYKLRKGFFTTCDLKDPHYRMVAKTITIYPGDRVVARNMVLKVGKTPVFYIPYYSHSLKDKHSPVEVMPGKGKYWGYYLLTSWRYHLNDNKKGRIHLDSYEKRGIGTGITYKVTTENKAKALFNFYRIEDTLYKDLDHDPCTLENFNDMYPERDSTAKYIEDDRYRLEFSYEWDPLDNLSIKGEFHKFSDQYFMKDFFEHDYEKNASPLSYILTDYAFSNSSLSMLIQRRANRFFSSTEYAPKLEYDFYEQRLGKSPIYLESKTILSNAITKTASSHEDKDSVRLYSHNKFSYPARMAWLRFTPYVGLHSSFYTKNTSGDENITRQVFESGIDINTKLYKYFDGGCSLFGERIEAWRHVLTPSISYGYIHRPTTASANLVESDGLTRTEDITFKLENYLQAKNEKKTWNYIYFAPYVVYKVNQEGKGSYFNNIAANLEVDPKENVSFDASTNYDVLIRRISSFNADFEFRNGQEIEDDQWFNEPKGGRYAVALGHRYSRTSSTQGTVHLKYQLTPRIQLKNYFRYEYNTGDLQEQEHGLRVDLHCWWMDFSFDIDNQKQGVKDVAFRIVFTLKAFPKRVHFGYGHEYKGIGDRI